MAEESVSPGRKPARVPRNHLPQPVRSGPRSAEKRADSAFGKIWRSIWTDGRELPKDPAPRWFGYSTGKWEDDYTFVVQTSGINDEVWVDRAGCPHSPDLRIEERFHRADADTLELTVTINDPKMYTKPWVALNKLPFKLQTPEFDVTEMMCSPSELAKYNEFIGGPASDKDSK